MSTLILSIFNNSSRNNQLLRIHRELNNNNIMKKCNIDYYFFTFDEMISDDYQLIDDILYIKGVEGYMNILDKTIKALHYFINIHYKKYDYIIRTNISSVFNYTLLHKYIDRLPKTNIYIGGLHFRLDWIDEKFNITEETIQKYNLHKLSFFQGTCIILSNDVACFLLKESNKLIYEIIDDVAIGLFIKTYLPSAYLTYINMPTRTIISSENKSYDVNSILYRHKTFDDSLDIEYITKTYKFVNDVM
jgi:hypothetical protein